MQNKKVKVILFEDKFGLGGIETFITNVILRIDYNLFDIELVVVNKVTDQYDSLFESLGVKVKVLVPTEELNPIKRFSKGLPAFKEYLRTNISRDTIIHFNLSDSIDLLYVYLAKKRGIKVRIVHSHNSSATSSLKTLSNSLCK
ncbi:hypothetical protein ACTQX0_08780 [Lactobacillus amylovorus]|uniref:hypothetical protein n=1 Tax=Lactobacillus amylovorus TaxID=1604 RepID=UPI003F9EA917